MKRIILDTNFLLIPIQFKVDIFEEIRRTCNFRYQLYIVDKTIEELEKIIEKEKTKDKAAARFALKLIKAKKIKKIKTDSDKYVDDIMVDSIKKEDVVATQDMELKRKLRKKGITLIVLRQKKYLIMV